MNPQAQPIYLLDNGRLIDGQLACTQHGDTAEACVLRMTYSGRVLNAFGDDVQEALETLQATLALEGIHFNIAPHAARLRPSAAAATALKAA